MIYTGVHQHVSCRGVSSFPYAGVIGLREALGSIALTQSSYLSGPGAVVGGFKELTSMAGASPEAGENGKVFQC